MEANQDEESSTNSSILEEMKEEDEVYQERLLDQLDQYLGQIDSNQFQNLNERLNLTRTEEEREQIAAQFEYQVLEHFNQRI